MNKISKSLSLVLISTAFIGCNWRLPEKISIKHKAEYNIPISNLDIPVEEYLNLDSIYEGINSQDDPDTKGFYYNPNNKAESFQLLVSRDLNKTSLNMSDYIDEKSITENIGKLSFDKTLEVPEISFDFNKKISISGVTDKINNLVAFYTYGSDNQISFITGDGVFESVEYANGYLEAQYLAGESLPYGTRVYLKYNGKFISSGTVQNDGEIVIQLAGKKLYSSDMTIEYSSSEIVSPDTRILWRVAEGSQIVCATGVTLAESVEETVTTDFQFDESSDEFEECTIEEGALNVTLDFSDRWENVNIGYDIDFTGAFNHYDPLSYGADKVIDMAGKKIRNGPTDVVSKIIFTLDNTTIYLTDEYAPEVNVVSDIRLVETAIFMVKDIETSKTESKELPSDMKDMVSSIGLEASGLNGHFETDFPENNDLQLSVKSDFFCIDETKVIETANKTGDFEMKSKFPDNAQVYDQKIENFEEITFNVNMILPGATPENPNRVVLHHIVPEKTYFMALDFDVELNWKYAKINSEKIDTAQTVTTGINFNEKLGQLDEFLGSSEEDSILDKIELKRLPLFLYVNLPEIFAGYKISGNIKAFYGNKDSAGNITKIPGTDVILCDKDKKMDSVMIPELQIEEDGKTVITDLDSQEYSFKTDELVTLINKVLKLKEGELIVDYNLSFENPETSSPEIIIYNDENLNKDAEVQVVANLVFPLEFEVKKDINLDVIKLMGIDTESDILGRETYDSLEGLTKDFVDLIKTVSLDYDITEFPFKINPSNAMKINANLYGDGKDYNGISLGVDKGSVPLDSVFINHVLESPFTPTINASIKATTSGTTLMVPSNLKVVLDAVIKVKMDGEFEIESPLSSKGGF